MTKAFKDKKTVFHGVKNSDGKKPNLEDPKYADAPFVDTNDGKTLEDVKKKFAPNADKPTSASADKQNKKLPEIMQKIDPEKKAQIIPEMYKQMQQLRNVLNAGSASGSGGAGQNGQNDQGNAGEGNAAVNPFLEDALTAAFVNLSKKFTFEYVIMIILMVLDDGGINKISSIYKETVTNAVINFIKLAIYYGPKNIPVSRYSLVPEAIPAKTPKTVIDYNDVPIMYVRQWYVLENNPYPAFIEWESPDGNTTVYTENTSEYYFDSASEEIFYNTEVDLTNDLIPYFKDKNLTASILNNILDKYALIIEQYNLDSSLGKGVGAGISQDQSSLNSQNNSGGGGGGGAGGIGQMMGMLQNMLGGQLKNHMQNILEKQLPKSVNDKQKVQKNIQLSTQDMANNKKGFDAIQKMFGSGAGGMMGGMNLQGMLSGLMSGSSGGGVSASGGSSGGGGGGAGSGVPSGQGNYNGGDVSSSGLNQIKNLLKVLGMS